MHDDLATRISILEAKDEVASTIATYCAINDELTAVDQLVDLFTEDAVMTNPSGAHEGKEAISRYYHAFFDGSTTFARHHTMNQVIEIVKPGVARHTSYFIAFLGRGGESKIAFGRYDDTLVRTDEGWRFTRKGNDVVRITTAEEGWALAAASLTQAGGR